MLFLCVHNAGRSQMALGWFNHLAGDRAVAWSGGSEPGTEINPAAIAAMAEVGIDITGEFPKPWTEEIVQAADVVITMGCGDACPLYPGKRYEDWELDDPAGHDVAPSAPSATRSAAASKPSSSRYKSDPPDRRPTRRRPRTVSVTSLQRVAFANHASSNARWTGRKGIPYVADGRARGCKWLGRARAVAST